MNADDLEREASVGDLVALYALQPSYQVPTPEAVGIYLGIGPVDASLAPFWRLYVGDLGVRYYYPPTFWSFRVLSTLEGAIG